MTPEIGLLFGILGIAVLLFCWEIVPADVVALGTMLALVLTGLVPATDAFSGFGSDTVMMILGLLIMTAALERTGLVDMTARAALSHTGENPTRLFLVVIVVACGIGAFMSNTASTAFFLPVVLGIARQSR